MAQRRQKWSPVGICDFCGGRIHPDEWYTSKGAPRLYCSINCRNTANSRAGSQERSRKARQRVARGEWQNPAKLNPPTSEEQSRRARLARKREVERGEWRNPALSPEAREKLSRPRKHSGALHSAIEKLGQGLSVSDLTPEEQEAHRAWRRELRQARIEQERAYQREWYRKNKKRKKRK